MKKKSFLYKSKTIAIVFFSLTILYFFTESHAQNSAIINFDSTHQIISGFGGANVIIFGRPNMTDSQIETAFGTGEGQLGFTILRLSIQNNSNQWSTNVNAARKAYDMGAKIIASPWSPPASMKSNSSTIGGELNESSYADYAAHLNAFADYMSNNGAPIYAISVQNEPDISVTYESCDWSPSQMLKFVKENGSSIGTRLMAPESFQFRRNMSDPLLNDSIAAANLDIVAGHIYGGGLSQYPLAKEKGKEIWMTEYLINSGSSSSTNPTSVDTGLVGAIQTAKSIHDCMVANMSAYVWWYIVRFYGPIDDGTFNSANAGSITKKGYVMSQFARFVRPGFFRIDATRNPQTGVYITAYKDSSKIIIIALNNSSLSKEQTFTLQGGSVSKFTPYITSVTKNCIQEDDITVSGNSFTVNLDPSTITTFISEYSPVDVGDFSKTPDEFHLFQNYPNPFNPSTTLSWHAPVSSRQTLKIYDILGNEVATIIDEFRPAGTYEVKFEAGKLTSGIYIYQLKAGSFVDTKKLMLLK